MELRWVRHSRDIATGVPEMTPQAVTPTALFDELLADIRMSRKITRHHQALLLQFTQTQTGLSDHQAQGLAQLHEWLRQGRIRVAV